MGRKAKELGALDVQRLKTPPGAFVGGVDGLYLNVSKTGARNWLLKFSLGGRRPEMGLGAYPDVPLAKARELAREAKDLIRQGINPINAARAKRQEADAKRATTKTFAECADAYIKGQEPGWKSRKHALQWRATLQTYAFPTIGEMPVRDIKPEHVLAILEPVWTVRHETASRVRSRVENILDFAISFGYREAPNPATMKANLAMRLAPSKKVSRVEHHAALDVAAMPAFWKRLMAVDGQGARALAFVILTAARSGEVRGATWAEIDFDKAVWTVPGTRMKMGRAHRVPLSNAALELLRSLPQGKADEFVFPSTKGTPLSDMTLSSVMRRLKVDAVPHGFRSTFRDWVSEHTDYPPEVAEMALAHAVGDKVEAAYRRGVLLEKRVALMEDWATAATTKVATNVRPIRRSQKTSARN